MEGCTKCGGMVISEKYYCDQGACTYTRCVLCGKVWFEKREGEEKEEEEEVASPDNRLSFSQIAAVMGVTKQAVFKTYKRAMRKIVALHPEYMRRPR